MPRKDMIQKNYDGDYNCHPLYERQDSAPEKVMFNMQGPLRLDKPLSIDGDDVGMQMSAGHYDQSMQNEDAQ